MALVPFVVIALIGAAIHHHREKPGRGTASTLQTFLIWWLVVAVGIAGLIGAMYHFFDGPGTAREIGFTNGDGGFQTEVGCDPHDLVPRPLPAGGRDRALDSVPR
jgi:hypothetical protein